MSAPSFEGLARASRELHLACDREGRIRYADDRAVRILGARVGEPLAALVAPGCEEKLEDFLRRALDAEVDCFEVPFVSRGKALTVSLCSLPDADGTLIIGHVIPVSCSTH